MQYYFMLAGSYKNRLTYFCRKFVFNKQILRGEPDCKQQGKNADDNNRINGGGQNVCFNNFSLRAGGAHSGAHGYGVVDAGDVADGAADYLHGHHQHGGQIQRLGSFKLQIGKQKVGDGV